MSFYITTENNGQTCPVCLVDFAENETVYAHKNGNENGEDVHKIHADCLELAIADPNAPKRCPSCRLAITSVNGQPIQQPVQEEPFVHDQAERTAHDDLVREPNRRGVIRNAADDLDAMMPRRTRRRLSNEV